jgi:Ankyrin repeat./Zinc finger, C3HC4 type (RING finger).
MNGKRDANNKILIPDSLKNSQENIYKMLCKILALFPSVYCDSKYLDSLYRDCEKPKDALSGLILILNSSGAYLDYYLRFASIILDDLIVDCKKNSVKFCELEDASIVKDGRSLINKVFCILWNLKLKFIATKEYEAKKLLSDFLKKLVDLLIQNGYKIDEADSVNVLPIHLSCCGIDEVAIGDASWDELYDGLTKHLIEKYEANVNARDVGGCTPLWYAVKSGKKSSISALLEHGADLENLDGKGTGFYELLKKFELAKNSEAVKAQDELLNSNESNVNPGPKYTAFVEALELHKRAARLFEYFYRIGELKEKFEKMKNNALERTEPLLKTVCPEDNCQICSSDFETENLRRLFLVDCGHNFCEKCIKKRFMDSDGKLECVLCDRDTKELDGKMKKPRGQRSDIEFETPGLRSKLAEERKEREALEREKEQDKEKAPKLGKSGDGQDKDLEIL